MFSIYKKEINAFFSSLVGYVAILLFVIVVGFFLWVVPDSNILDEGYATLDKFFILAPWLLMFLIPALTMRAFSDEFKSGTIEVLSTLPLSESSIILGKFLASFTLVFVALIPTCIYIYTISTLSIIPGNIDSGGILGSFIGLSFLNAAFTSIGIFCSSVTSNQVIAFLFALFLNFVIFTGFDTLARIPVFDSGIDYIISQLGMQFHYSSISRGLLDSRDIVYFLSLVALFVLGTKIALERRKW